ncbi:hypothetical protein QEZ52_13890 [Aliisedimentitalea scapharcae]|uniref:Lipoprotein n=1 Tax=Aliisedimentitalea scapharcae TaxID=1524259 RepID=A0ABZ2XNN9_9RHOB|nr:hypothetical protein K3727_13795 [Rhodobacteraceae bacterium M382]
MLARIQCLILIGATLGLTACVPEPGTQAYQDYQTHKANRNAVMGQGGR